MSNRDDRPMHNHSQPHRIVTCSKSLRLTHNSIFGNYPMKRQLFAFAAGAILLVSPALSKTVMAQNTAAPTRTERSAEWKQFRQSLNLTETQKTSLKEIRKNAQVKMDAILTGDQLAQRKAAREAYKNSGKKGDRPMSLKALNLTADQKESMKKVRKEVKDQTQAIYTPEQKAIIQKFRASHPRREKTSTWRSTDPVNTQK